MRRSSRYQLVDASIKLRKSGMLNFLLNTDNQASLVNISTTGLQLMITETLKANDQYQINLYVPGIVNPFIMKAQVMWCRPYKKFFDKTYYRAGFKFIKLNEEIVSGLKKIEKIARHRLPKSPQPQPA